jgi:hypothetical protein
MKKKKETIFKILAIVFFSLSILLSVFNHAIKSGSDNPVVIKAKVLMAEYQYKKDPSAENLFALCDNLYSTDEYEKIRKYYPQLLEAPEMYNYLGNYCEDTTEQNNCYDLFLIKYLVASTTMDDFDARLFVEDMRKHKSDDVEFYTRMGLLAIAEFREDRDSLSSFNGNLDLLMEHLTKEEKSAILVVQSNIHEELGETSLSDQKMDEARFVQSQTN